MLAVVLLALCAFVLLTGSPASAASLVGKDGKIHACYKAKGKGKGTLRVVRSAKAKCPKKWKKVSWYASGPAGPQGQSGSNGGNGETGTNGSNGLPGTNATATVVKGLENKVTELLNKVASLETVLAGIDNQQLKEAIASVADVKALESTVGSLCSQSSTLTSQLNAVESPRRPLAERGADRARWGAERPGAARSPLFLQLPVAVCLFLAMR